MADIRVVVWNVEWQSCDSRRGRQIREIIEAEAPDLVFLTEAYSGTLPLREAAASPDYGYQTSDGRRKVLMYSRESWAGVQTHGETDMPLGRCVSALTRVRGTQLWCCGVCVPWMMAHVATGAKNRRAWEEHRRFLDAFPNALGNTPPAVPAILGGDFNQTIPQSRAPDECYNALLKATGHLRCVTSGLLPGACSLDVDHVFVSRHFEVNDVRVLPNLGVTGKPLSDHDGISLDLSFQ